MEVVAEKVTFLASAKKNNNDEEKVINLDDDEDGESTDIQVIKESEKKYKRKKKPEKKEGMNESRRLFGILKENKKVLFETTIENPKNFKNLQKAIIKEAKRKGINPADVRLVSENKIIR